MGCCGSSSTSPGPSHMSFAAAPGAAQTTSTSVEAPWRVTFRDGSVAWFSNQLVAYAEAGVNGGAVDYIPGGAGGATVIPAQ